MLLEADSVVVNNDDVLQITVESAQIFVLLSACVHRVVLAVQEVLEVLSQPCNFENRFSVLLWRSSPEYQFVLPLEPL